MDVIGKALEDHQTLVDTGRPYIEDGDIRTFLEDTPSLEFVWHRDKEDRWVECTHDTDWLFQLDNEVPQRLTKDKLFIPKETYHRLIKRTGDLVVKIWQKD